MSNGLSATGVSKPDLKLGKKLGKNWAKNVIWPLSNKGGQAEPKIGTPCYLSTPSSWTNIYQYLQE